MPGMYTFRMHADYGLGAYVGVDGAEFTDSTWGHVEIEPASLSSGEHEFESLVRSLCWSAALVVCCPFAN